MGLFKHSEACQQTALIPSDTNNLHHRGQKPCCSPVPGKQKCYLSPNAPDDSRNMFFPIVSH